MGKYKNYTNAELNIKMKDLENEYEACKKKALGIIDEMRKLDAEYCEVKKESQNRTLTLWQ